MTLKNVTYLTILFLFWSCSKSFGNKKEFGNLEVYYSKTPIEYVNGIGQYFKENNLILKHKHSVKLTSTADSFVLKMILNSKFDSLPPQKVKALTFLEEDIRQKVFANLNFKIEICDANFYPLNLKH
ncbi:MAG TPA: hypothetical protein EYG85_10845 [Crocinitomix sp.]|nr:hypothetical protein [Crocinitomix sp.]